MKGSANRGRTRLERSTGAHLSAGAFCCLTAWTGPVWVPRNPSCSWCGVGRRAFAQTGPRAVISAHIQASIVNPVFVERLVRFVRIYPLRYGLSFQVSYWNNPTHRGAAKHGICFASRLVPSNVNSYTVTPPFTPLTFLLHWESQPDTTLPYDSGRRSVRSGLPAPKLGRRRRTVLKLSYRGIP